MSEFIGIIKSRKLAFASDQKKLYESCLASFKDNTRVSVKVERLRKPKTNQQVKTHWGLCVGMVKTVFDDRGYDTSMFLNLEIPTGVSVPKRMITEILYAAVGPRDDEGEIITISNKKMTSEKMSKFFEESRNWIASQWHIHIPEPNPNWWKNKESKDG